MSRISPVSNPASLPVSSSSDPAPFAQGGNPGTGGGEGASAASNAGGQQVQAQSGSSNTGGGGGGGAWDGTQAPLGHIQSSGAGGSGIVMVRYQFQSS